MTRDEIEARARFWGDAIDALHSWATAVSSAQLGALIALAISAVIANAVMFVSAFCCFAVLWWSGEVLLALGVFCLRRMRRWVDLHKEARS